jgi:FAS-associated factor 2
LPIAIISTSFKIVGRTVGFGLNVAGAIAQRVLPAQVSNSLRSAARAITAGPAAEDPAASAMDFIQNFTAKHGERVPRWQACGWQEAATRAQSEGKFLFVYLHSARHQDTDSFCANTLCAPNFVDYLNSTFLAWAGDVRFSDAFRLSSSLRAAAYPYCALLAFSGARTRLVTCVEGSIRPDALAEVLQAALVEHGSMLWEERAAQEQRQIDRQLREEQDAEYQRSLEADRERERKREEERAAVEAVERQRQEAAAAAAAAIAAEEQRKAEFSAKIERRRSEKRLSLPEEPSADVPNTTLIRIRLPNGSTHQRRFMASDQLQIVQDWVDGLESHEHLKYSLAMTYPRKVFVGIETMMQSLEELDLTPQAVLLVQPEDEDGR